MIAPAVAFGLALDVTKKEARAVARLSIDLLRQFEMGLAQEVGPPEAARAAELATMIAQQGQRLSLLAHRASAMIEAQQLVLTTISRDDL